MFKRTLLTPLLILACTAIGVFTVASHTLAQRTSLLTVGAPGEHRPLMIEDASWIYQDLPIVKEVKLYDILTVEVSEKSRVISEHEFERDKLSVLDARIQDWIILKNLNLKPSPQSDGEPRIRARFQSQGEGEASLETRDGIDFTIACKVVDIRPNGNLVIEGHQQVRNNEEYWERSLTGVIRAEDINEARVVKSEDVADMRIHKRERGEVRDGYKRGWLTRFLQQVNPF